MSKGSKPRPIENKEHFDKQWEHIFGKKPKAPQQPVDNKGK